MTPPISANYKLPRDFLDFATQPPAAPRRLESVPDTPLIVVSTPNDNDDDAADLAVSAVRPLGRCADAQILVRPGRGGGADGHSSDRARVRTAAAAVRRQRRSNYDNIDDDDDVVDYHNDEVYKYHYYY